MQAEVDEWAPDSRACRGSWGAAAGTARTGLERPLSTGTQHTSLYSLDQSGSGHPAPRGFQHVLFQGWRDGVGSSDLGWDANELSGALVQSSLASVESWRKSMVKAMTCRCVALEKIMKTEHEGEHFLFSTIHCPLQTYLVSCHLAKGEYLKGQDSFLQIRQWGWIWSWET